MHYLRTVQKEMRIFGRTQAGKSYLYAQTQMEATRRNLAASAVALREMRANQMATKVVTQECQCLDPIVFGHTNMQCRQSGYRQSL